MNDLSEKRAHQRHTCEIPVWWCYFNRREQHTARVLNISEEGIYLETGIAPRAGATILIKRRYPDDVSTGGQVHPPCRDLSLVEVRWCSDTKSAEQRMFGVGTRFFNIGYP
jgi:hypothetical protein